MRRGKRNQICLQSQKHNLAFVPAFVKIHGHAYVKLLAAHFNDIKWDISSLWFCSIEFVSGPPRGGDQDLFLRRREAILDIYIKDSQRTGKKKVYVV